MPGEGGDDVIRLDAVFAPRADAGGGEPFVEGIKLQLEVVGHGIAGLLVILQGIGSFLVQPTIPNDGEVRGQHAGAHASECLDEAEESVGGKAIRGVHAPDGVEGTIGVMVPINDEQRP